MGVQFDRDSARRIAEAVRRSERESRGGGRPPRGPANSYGRLPQFAITDEAIESGAGGLATFKRLLINASAQTISLVDFDPPKQELIYNPWSLTVPIDTIVEVVKDLKGWVIATVDC